MQLRQLTYVHVWKMINSTFSYKHRSYSSYSPLTWEANLPVLFGSARAVWSSFAPNQDGLIFDGHECRRQFQRLRSRHSSSPSTPFWDQRLKHFSMTECWATERSHALIESCLHWQQWAANKGKHNRTHQEVCTIRPQFSVCPHHSALCKSVLPFLCRSPSTTNLIEKLSQVLTRKHTFWTQARRDVQRQVLRNQCEQWKNNTTHGWEQTNFNGQRTNTSWIMAYTPLCGPHDYCCAHEEIQQSASLRKTFKHNAALQLSMMFILCSVVISQTNRLVSQERLSPEAGTSIFIMYRNDIWWMVLTFETGVSHHTPPPLGGAGLYRQFLIFWIFL